MSELCHPAHHSAITTILSAIFIPLFAVTSYHSTINQLSLHLAFHCEIVWSFMQALLCPSHWNHTVLSTTYHSALYCGITLSCFQHITLPYTVVSYCPICNISLCLTLWYHNVLSATYHPAIHYSIILYCPVCNISPCPKLWHHTVLSAYTVASYCWACYISYSSACNIPPALHCGIILSCLQHITLPYTVASYCPACNISPCPTLWHHTVLPATYHAALHCGIILSCLQHITLP